MKSADEIILQKEWQQLSPGEKDMILDIAATEKEYNLLKKILQASAVETNDVPALDPALSLRIRQAAGSNKQANRQWYGWLAAACVIGLILAIIMFSQKDDTLSFVKEKVEVKQPGVKKATVQEVPNDSLLVKKPVQKNMNPAKKLTPAPLQTIPVNDPGKTDVAFVNVTVAEEMGLLDLINEAE